MWFLNKVYFVDIGGKTPCSSKIQSVTLMDVVNIWYPFSSTYERVLQEPHRMIVCGWE